MRLPALLTLAAAVLAAAPARAQTCTTRPDLCNRPVTSEVNESNLSIAHDIVFVGDGYTQADLSKFASDVNAYITELKTAASTRAIVPVDPTVFNFHRVDVVSTTNNLANTDTSDTAFGAVATEFNSITYNTSSVTFAASRNAPDVDTVVMVVNSPDGRSNAYFPTGHTTGGRIAIRTPSVGVFPHELGHAMFRLVDEYTSNTGCYSGTELDLLQRPNVITEASGQKFARAGTPSP
ncbi:MAG: M64 family metallopeptidase, partial [Myxococcales bacterium]